MYIFDIDVPSYYIDFVSVFPTTAINFSIEKFTKENSPVFP